MLSSQNLHHRIALDYRRKKKVNDFVTVGKKFEYKNSIFSLMFVMICHCGGTCLIRLLHWKNSK
jgi:hypothetical protein